MDAVLTYQDDAPDLLTELHDYAAAHPGTVLLCTEHQPLPGLPVIADDAERVYRDYRQYLGTPWGLAAYTDVRYSRYPTLTYADLHTLVEPRTDVPLPRIALPEPGAALVQPLTGTAAVYAGDRLAPDFDREQPVWEGKIAVPEHWHAVDLLRTVRLALAQAALPVYPATLYMARVDYPWLTSEGLPAPTATITNGEVQLPLVGYAVDPESNEVIYLSLVAHKTAARSIWGSLSTAHQRKLLLDAPEHRMTVVSSHRYATYTDILDADTGLLRMQIVDRRVAAADVEDRAYLVAPAGLDTAALHAAFAARLNAVLPVGVPGAWGARLHEVGDDVGLVRRCFSGGDVGVAYALSADDEWLGLITQLLRNDAEFAIPRSLV